MPPATGMHSHGTRMYVADWDGVTVLADYVTGTVFPAGGNGNFTELDEVFSINGVPMNPSVTRITHLNSDGKAHEKVPGIIDGGQVSFSFNHTAALVAILAALVPNPATNDVAPRWGRHVWVVQFPDGGQWWFIAFVQGSPNTVPDDDRNTVEATLEISGRPIFSEAV